MTRRYIFVWTSSIRRQEDSKKKMTERESSQETPKPVVIARKQKVGNISPFRAAEGEMVKAQNYPGTVWFPAGVLRNTGEWALRGTLSRRVEMYRWHGLFPSPSAYLLCGENFGRLF